MRTYLNVMPIDRTQIMTRLKIHPDLLNDPNEYIQKHGLSIRTVKATKGKCRRGTTRNLTLDVLTYGGIKAELREIAGDQLTDVTIDFNPGKCLRSHNGSVLSLAEFLDALAILVTHLKPLLNDPEDWVDLIPGLRSGGVAYWANMETFLHCSDPDGTLLAGYRNAQQGNGQSTIRHWPESMLIGGNRSKIKFGIYRKAVEMVAHDKLPHDQMSDYQHILRLEVRLKAEKLVHYLGNERNVERIDGVPRLVRFYPQDHLSALRTSFGNLNGVFNSGMPLEELQSRGELTVIGRLLACVAADQRTPHTFQDLLALIRFYTQASSDTMGAIRSAGIQALENLSTIARDELFSDNAYMTQDSVWSQEREKKVCHEIEDVVGHPLIYKAYRPPNQPFQQLTQWPEYLRV